MKHFALIGHPLSHSLSKQWFDQQHFPDADYRLHSVVDTSDLRRWVADEAVAGFNVTSPHKQMLARDVDILSPEAEAIGAVNCVVVQGDCWIGHNTDAPAFGHVLDEWLAHEGIATPSLALILGSGGAARAVAYAFRQRAVPCHLVSRTPSKQCIGYAEARNLLPNHPLLVNATPLGMPPHALSNPWPWPAELGMATAVFDLIYNPSPTLFMREAMQQGVRTSDGLAMLHRQAQLSWQLWGLI